MNAPKPPPVGSKFLLGAAAFVIVVAGLRAAQSIIIPTLLSAFLAILCAPIVVFLARRKVPTVAAVLLVVLLVMAMLAGVGTILGGSVNGFTEAIPRYQSRMNGLIETSGAWLAAKGVRVSALNLGDIADPGQFMGVIGKTLGGLVAALSNTFLVLLTLVFILLEAAGFPAKLNAIAADGDAALERYSGMMAQVQQYLFIKTVLSLVTGILVGVWLAILGVDFPVLWGLIAFLLNYVPNLGSIIAAIPAVLLALVQLGVGYSVAAAAGYLVVNVAIGNVIEPQLLGRRLGLSTLVVFLSLVFWGWVWGPVGMLLSVPLTMIVKIMLEHTQDLRWIAILLDSPAAVATGPSAPLSAPAPGAHPGRGDSGATSPSRDT